MIMINPKDETEMDKISVEDIGDMLGKYMQQTGWTKLCLLLDYDGYGVSSLLYFDDDDDSPQDSGASRLSPRPHCAAYRHQGRAAEAGRHARGKTAFLFSLLRATD